jgi:serine phosphatase RsbU (regulator of sigma subunit)
VLRQDGGVSLLVGDACGHDAQDVWDNAVRFCLFLSQPEVARKLGLTPSDPRELLLDVDRGCNFRGNFAHDSITLTHVLIDPASGVFSVANAANPCPVIVVGPRGARRIQAKGASISHPDLEACGASYLSSEATVLSGVLDVGEMLLLGTDGLVDSEDENGVPLGETLEGRLMQERVWELSPRQALDAAFSMIKVRKDDVAIMVAKRTC